MHCGRLTYSVGFREFLDSAEQASSGNEDEETLITVSVDKMDGARYWISSDSLVNPSGI